MSNKRSYESNNDINILDNDSYILDDKSYILNDDLSIKYNESCTQYNDLSIYFDNLDKEIKTKKKKSRYISIHVKREILSKYNGKCANNPFNPILKDYMCPMWQLYNGNFDIAGYEFDHIDEYSITKDNTSSNLQPLCPSCHKVKTKKFMNNKCIFTSTDLNNGRCIMEIDKEIKPHKKIKLN